MRQFRARARDVGTASPMTKLRLARSPSIQLADMHPQNCGAVPQTSVQDQGAARMIEDYYDFPRGSDS